MSAAPDIFLSYNREDADIARRFAQGFEAQGFDVWWDQALRSGEAYDEVTEAALRSARAVVVLWSPRSAVSRWVRAEATIAERNKTLIPAKIEPCDLPVMFELTQTADLTHWRGAPDDKAWLGFLGDVRRMAGKVPVEPAAKTGSAPAPAGSGIPIVAVLPLTCRGGGEEMDFLAEDLTEEITRELSRNGYFEVIAAGIMAAWRGKQVDYRAMGRELDARYLAEGKLQRSGETVRLTMQLIDASTGKMPWTKRFVRDAGDIEASLEKFAAAATAELAEHVLQIEVDRAKSKSGSLSGWEHALRSNSYSWRLGSDSHSRGIEEARLAVAAAPGLGIAHAQLAAALSTQITVEGAELDDAKAREIRTHVTRAMQQDGDNPVVIGMLVNAYAVLGDGESAVRVARRALDLDTNASYSYLLLGFAHEVNGQTEEAIAAYEQQFRLTSQDASRYAALTNLARCYALDGRLAEAEDALDQSLALHPDYHNALKWKAIVAALRGDEQAALATVRRLREVEPEKPIDQHVRQMQFYVRHADRMAEPVATLRRLWHATEVAE